MPPHTSEITYLVSRDAARFACCQKGERGVWQTQLAHAAGAAVGNGGGHGGDVVDSAHVPPPGVDGLEVHGTHIDLDPAPTGGVVVVAELAHAAVTLTNSRSRSLQTKCRTV